MERILKKGKRICRNVTKVVKKRYEKTVLGKISKVVNRKSYFPELKRKKKIYRYFDNFKWYFKYSEVNNRYNIFGFDIIGFRNSDEYLSKKAANREKKEKHHNNLDPIKYKYLSINKYLFYCYLGNIKLSSIPKLRYLVFGKKILAPLDTKTDVISAIAKLPNKKYVCKPVMGEKGASIYIIEKKSNNITINNGNVNEKEFIKGISNKKYLIQDYVEQHKAMSKLNPTTVNTVRIVTTRWNVETHILGALVRIGTKQDKLVDNASQGGTFVGINDDGKLKEYGYYYYSTREKSHPLTDVEYKDYQIPYWTELVELVKQLHPYFPGLATIGWDIAITSKGPVILEINSNYCTKLLQVANGGLKKKWYELKKK